MDVAALRHSVTATPALTETTTIRSHLLPQQPSQVRFGPGTGRARTSRLATTAWSQGLGSPAELSRQGQPSGAVLASGTSMSPPVEVLRVAAGSAKAEKEASGSALDRFLPGLLLAERSSLPSAFERLAFESREESSPAGVQELQVREVEVAPGDKHQPQQQVQERDVDELWLRVREEARRDAEAEPALASYLYSTVLMHRSLESALASHLANKLGSATLLSTHLLSLFRDVLLQNPGVCTAMRRDVEAAKERDPACTSYLHCLLNFKGFCALQTHRIAHELWQRGRHSLALALQSRSSEVFHVDIHPAAKFGSGVLLDHATGIVVGETAEVGDDVSMLHGVTLGGSGIVGGVRHPKIGDGVVLGTGVRVLGPVLVGRNAKVGACSLVLEDVGEGTTVVGNPAREVKKRDMKKVPLSQVFILDYSI